MPYAVQTRDLTGQYLGYDRDIDTFRPAISTTFTPGLAVKLVDQSLQIYADAATVGLPSTTIGATQNLLMGVVADTWTGFQGQLTSTPSFTSGSTPTTTRGTQGVDIVLRGFHPALFIDQSGAGAVTIVNGLPIVPSVATAGRGQGVATATATGGLGTIGIAMLPVGSFFGSSLTAAALAQAAATFTIAGPVAGDVYSYTVTAPFSTAAPGVGQLFTYTVPALSAGQAASATTAAAAVVAFLNAQTSFSTYWIATNALGVVSFTVNALASPWQITFGTNGVLTNQYNLALSGMIANNATNGLVVTAAAVGTGTNVVTTQFAGGTGYKGTIPVYVVPS